MSANYKIDDSIVFKNIDETLVNMDIKYLMQTKLELMKEGKDTSVIDKAIKERKRRDEVIKKNNERRANQEKRMNKMKRRALVLGLIDGLSSDLKTNNTVDNDLMSWEEDAIKNYGYEKHNFEEEEVEEDDYYFEDDK